MAPKWRLISHERDAGNRNMAIDRAIQIARHENRVPPTLRLYGWLRPTVTIGRFQKSADVDSAACDALGVDVVRRCTGGRGVLHDDEITYSCVAALADDVPRGTNASYAHLCSGIVAAYGRLGVSAQLTERARGTRGSAACYLHATSADVSCGEAKLSGSAQVWLHDTVLQHGSFVISRDIDREARVFGLSPEARAELAAGSVTLSDLISGTYQWDELCSLIAAGWADALGIELEAGELTDDEIELAERLAGQTVVEPTRDV